MNFSRVKENLEKRGFTVSVFDTAAAAADYLDAAIDGKSVGFSGSITLQQMGLAERLEQHNELFWHWKVKEGTTPADALRDARSAEVYVTSVNGLAESGEIINESLRHIIVVIVDCGDTEDWIIGAVQGDPLNIIFL